MSLKHPRPRWFGGNDRYPKTDENLHVLERIQEERYRPGFRKGARCKQFRRWEVVRAIAA